MLIAAFSPLSACGEGAGGGVNQPVIRLNLLEIINTPLQKLIALPFELLT
jgi:hypothetical protein